MEVWRFGEILSSGFQNEPQTGFSELTPDAGNPFRRVEFTDVQDIIKGSFVLGLDSYLDFMNWYKNTIRQGSLQFEYYDCRVGQNRVARMLGKPSYSTSSNRYIMTVTLSLESVTLIKSFNLVSETGDNLITETGSNIAVDVELDV